MKQMYLDLLEQARKDAADIRNDLAASGTPQAPSETVERLADTVAVGFNQILKLFGEGEEA